MKRLGYPQSIALDLYIDCKERSKKKIDFSKNSNSYTDDEKMVKFLLSNSSIIEHESERSFSKVSDAINLICKNLCPGEWCTRSHCKNYSSHCAYNCEQTRPSVCKEYKKYLAKKQIKRLQLNK